MLAYYSKRSRGEDFEQLDRPINEQVWVNGVQLTEDELVSVTDRYDLDRNIVYDVKDHQELSRVEFKGDDEAYVFLRVPRLAKSGHVAAHPLLCILKQSNFFSLSMQEGYVPEEIHRVSGSSATMQTTNILLGVIAACIVSYQELLAHTERSINDTGSRLRTHEVTNQDFVHFVVVEDNLTAYRMNLGGVLAVVNRLKETSRSVIDRGSHEALDDLSLQIQQLLGAVESYSSRVESIRNAYSTIANNTLNHRMKTLTVFTILITVPNVFYGMFGMNVLLPFSENDPLAYLIIVVSTILLTIGLYLIAKHRKLF